MPIPKSSSPVIRTTAREKVYHTVQQWIISGVLLPGERLNDMEIAKYFSVSRTPVREAVQMLAEQKLVVIMPSSGTYVAPIDINDMIHVYNLLAGLQSYAIDLGKNRITKDFLGVLHTCNENFYHNIKIGSVIETIKNDSEFHIHIAKLSDNPYLIKYTEQLIVLANRNEIQFFKTIDNLDKSYNLHKSIISSLESGNFNVAKKAVQENWRLSVNTTVE